MTTLRTATACLPGHANDEAALARLASEYGVGEVMGGLITANMPNEFANLTMPEKQVLWGMSQIPGKYLLFYILPPPILPILHLTLSY